MKQNPFDNLGNYDMWIEDDMFNKNDSKETIEISKESLKEIEKNDPYFEPTEISDIDEVTVEDLLDGELETDSGEPEEIETTPAYIQWDDKKTAVSTDKRPRIYLSTDFNCKIKAANKI